MDYEILVAEHYDPNQASEQLAEQVRRWIEDGWEPQGGVSFYVHRAVEGPTGTVGTFYTFSQAMIFKEDTHA